MASMAMPWGNSAILPGRHRIQHERAFMDKFSPVAMMLDFAYGGRRPAHAKASPSNFDPARPTSADTAAAPPLALAAASRAWWESRRPPGWTLEQHLADPTAGCNGTAQERALAEAVAHWVGQGR
jgi:hypothetical protein